MSQRIRLAPASSAATVARIVSESNRDVAARFGLDAGNCPKHPSFCTPEWVEADFQRGEVYFVFEQDGQAVACVAYESPNAQVAYLNRLSVLPSARRQGIGERLVTHIVDYAGRNAKSSVSIGVIGEHTALQDWYRRRGFADGETKRFAHLPFSVKYMARAVSVPQVGGAIFPRG